MGGEAEVLGEAVVGTMPEVVPTMTVPAPSGLNLKRTELPEEDRSRRNAAAGCQGSTTRGAGSGWPVLIFAK
jgi:hypothetical protein